MAYGGPQGYGAPQPGGYHGPQGGPHGGPYQPPGYVQPPKKKGMNGCLLAFLITGGLFLVMGIGGGIWFYISFKDFVDASGDMMGIVVKARNAPGTDEVRELGCQDAVALDMKELTKVAQRFEDAMAKRENREPKELDLDDEAAYYVQCSNPKKKLSCEDVAKTFIKAVEPKGRIVVGVQTGSSSKECTETFDQTGKKLGAGQAPNLDVQ
ncbi:MAG: hypothetical protein HOV80_25295 [Polyangiaceae bacterium]|nr:hypothetical protein [Polyangiaceae bacterium]